MRLREGLSINQHGHLVIGGCDAIELAREYGTPLYVYDEAYMRKICAGFTSAMERCAPGGVVAYAGKAFLNTAMVRLMHKMGIWLDCVSEGELLLARTAGFPAEHIILHGNNKTMRELELAVDMGVGRIVIDDASEMTKLAGISRARGIRQNVLLRINPGVEAHTHEYVQTARIDSKFGVGRGEALSIMQQICAEDSLQLVGLHMHLGSQIFELDPFDEACVRMIGLMDELRKTTGIVLPEADMGGGFSVHYTNEDAPVTPDEAVQRVTDSLRRACEALNYPLPRAIIEPGRAIVGEAGIALYTIGAIKQIPGIRLYASVDGSLADNPRPAMYGAKYECALAGRMNDTADTALRISGRTCEADTLIDEARLPMPREGDILAVFTSGAYQYAMAGNYNRLPLPAVVFVRDGVAGLVSRRETPEELMRLDSVPEWLA